MIRWRRGHVLEVRQQWPGVREVMVRLSDAEPDVVRALAYVRLTGAPEIGDLVLLNTTALAMGLGTGGFALVVAIPDRLPPDSPDDPPAAPGHLVKARYTPMQATVLGADEQDSPHHEVLREADDLAGMPVVSAGLHSSLPAVLAGLRASGGRDLRVVYLMTDGGALPAWFSRAANGLTEAGWLAATVTAGQAFGGDLESVTLHSGLLAARHVLGADVVVAAQGPGNLGTGTRWGFSGVQAGETINAAGTLAGRPVAVLRISGADARPRHRGVSHHSLTAYGRVALAPCDVAVPLLDGDLADLGATVLEQVEPLQDRHRLVEVDLEGLSDALAETPVRLSTMGRGLQEDPAAFLAAAAAGRHAAALAVGA